MIEYFVCGEDVLRLRNSLVDAPDAHETNIFAIDSISLLIGENGAGKTHLLDSIFDGLNRPVRNPRPFEWEPVFARDPDAAGKVGVVYLSQAPHHRKKKHLEKWCIDASPLPGASDLPEILLDDPDNVLSTLTGDMARIVATWHINPRLILRHCIGALLNSLMTLPTVWESLGEAFADLAVEYDRMGPTFGIRKIGGVPQRMPIVGTYPQFDQQTALLLDEMFDLLREHHSPAWQALFYFRLETLLQQEADAATLDALFEAWSNEANAFALADRIDGRDGDQTRALRAWLAGAEIQVEPRDIKVTTFLENRHEIDRMRASPLGQRVRIGWNNVSSGLWALATQCQQLRTAIGSLAKRDDLVSILVLIDEGDAFLHLEWQRQYIATMNRFLAGCKKDYKVACLQLMIATHSPLLATDVPSTYVNRIHKRRLVATTPSFAAPLQTLLNTSFGAKTIGEHAMVTISAVMQRIASGTMTSEDRYVIGIVDDPVIRRELERLLRLYGERAN